MVADLVSSHPFLGCASEAAKAIKFAEEPEWNHKEAMTAFQFFLQMVRLKFFAHMVQMMTAQKSKLAWTAR